MSVDVTISGTPPVVYAVEVSSPGQVIDVVIASPAVIDVSIEGVQSYTYIFNETLTGTVNGSNATFTTAFDFLPGLIDVFINGLKQKIVSDYQTSGTRTVTFTDSPVTGDRLLVNYIK